MSSKELIFQAAAKLFKEKGYAATSMRELALQVGLEASSLYNHIKSKEEILQEICLRNAGKFTQGMKNIQENSDLNALQKLESIIRLHVQIASEDISSVTVFNDEWKHLKEPALSDFLKLRKQYEQSVKSILQDGIEKEVLKKVDIEVALFSFLTSLRWIHYKFVKGRISSERLTENLKNILIYGLAKS
jgi:AcrR family transcriptional regulator